MAKNDYFAIDGPFRESIAHSGWVGILIFILIQITQVVYPIIPGGLTCVIRAYRIRASSWLDL